MYKHHLQQKVVRGLGKLAYANVKVPMSLLLNKQLTPADKLVWMIMQLDRVDHHGPKLASPTRLVERTRLSRFTIYNSLKRLTATGWYEAHIPIAHYNKTGSVYMPATLLRSSVLLPRDIIMYGLLRAEPFFRRQKGKFTYLDLSKYAQQCAKTVRRAVQALVQARWIEIQQANKWAPIQFKLANPLGAYRLEIERRINTSKFKGEAIGREMVVFLVKQAEFHVNTKPNWLTNPATGALLEVDLLIPKYDLVMEYQGEQHFNETEFCSAAEVAKQQARDAEKAKILKDLVKKLILLNEDDLSIDKIKMKLVGLAPLRDLEGLGPIQYYLDGVGRNYRAKAARKKAEREAQWRAQEQAQAQQQAQAQAKSQPATPSLELPKF